MFNRPSAKIVSDNPIKFIARQIKFARQMRHITIEQLATSLGITNKQLQNYETGQCNISITRIWEIAKILQIDPSFLICGKIDHQAILSPEQQNLLICFEKIRSQEIKDAIINLIKDF